MPVDWDAEVLGPLMGIFGEPATYMPAAGGSFPVIGIFDKAYQKETLFDDGTVGVTTELPVFGIQLSQFPAMPVQGDRLSVASINTTYAVREVRQDSHGCAKLMLNKISSP